MRLDWESFLPAGDAPGSHLPCTCPVTEQRPHPLPLGGPDCWAVGRACGSEAQTRGLGTALCSSGKASLTATAVSCRPKPACLVPRAAGRITARQPWIPPGRLSLRREVLNLHIADEGRCGEYGFGTENDF